ncbi:autotransporter domain-containing protein [Glaciimonas sp. GNP009]
MNKIYKSVWNEATGSWIVVSENAKGRVKSSKGSRSSAILSMTALAFIGIPALNSFAQSYIAPTGNSYSQTLTTVSNGNTAAFTTPFNANAVVGNGAIFNSYTLNTANAANLPNLQSNPIALPLNLNNYWAVSPTNQNASVTQVDPVTKVNRTVSVYTDASLSYATIGDAGNFGFIVATPGTANLYIQAGMASVDHTGGTLNVNIGDNVNTTDSGNALKIAARQTDITFADGTGSAASNINWTSKNRIIFDSTPVIAPVAATTIQGYVTQFGGAVIAPDGALFSVTNPVALQTYNAYLISLVTGSFGLTQAAYNAAFKQALGAETPITVSAPQWTNGQANTTDAAALDVKYLSVMHASGTNATATLTGTGVLEVAGSTDGALRADGGGHIINNGLLSVMQFSGSTLRSIAMTIDGAGSTGVNSGVVTSGAWLNADGTRVPQGPLSQGNLYQSFGAQVTNNGVFTNTGIINAALEGGPAQAIGIFLNGGGAAASNSGIINISESWGSTNASAPNGQAFGVLIQGAGSFVNQASGTIYIGRAPQAHAGDIVPDVAINNGNVINAAIMTNGNNVSIVNDGTLTLGSLVQDAAGIAVLGATNFSATNNGAINVNGGAGLAAPLQNVGFLVLDSTVGTGAGAINNGAISVVGANNVGIKVLDTGSFGSEITSTIAGSITVAGGIDPTSGTRNYGVWAEGTGSGVATANIDSAINLTGVGAIGVLARGNAVINVGADVLRDFGNTDEIGFFIDGAHAKINVSAANLIVNTDRSTLFRIADGASFSGQGLKMTASGINSTALLGTGSGTAIKIDNAVINVNNAGATAVLIEGGATGDISALADINLNSAGAIGGVVDGQQHSLTGALVGTPDAATRLTSAKALTGSADNIVGFITRNLGQLDNSGNIALTGTDSMGIDVQQAGRLNNTGTITVGGGVGVRASGSDAEISNLGTVTVNAGVADVQLVNGAALTLTGTNNRITTSGAASGVLLDTHAASLDASNLTITANGTGAGIENKAEIGAVKLNNVTINASSGSAIRTATSFDPTSSVTLNVLGSGTGIAFQQYGTGADVASNVVVGPRYAINVSGVSGTGIQAKTTGDVITSGLITVSNTRGGAAIVAHDAATITNTGTLSSASISSIGVIDASGTTAKMIINSGTIVAASNANVAILGGDGGDKISLVGGAVTGKINGGSGANTVNWTGGTLAGEINLGSGNNNKALVGAVDLATTRHVTANAGTTGNTLEFSGTQNASRGFGSFTADDMTRGLNIGNSYNGITLSNGADMRVIGDLSMQSAASSLNVADTTSVLRIGGSGATAGSVLNRNITDKGNVVFDNLDIQSYGGAISGSGNMTRDLTGTTTLTGGNTYSGITTVLGGTLAAGATNTFSAASVHTVNVGATLDLAGFDQRIAGLNNAGTVRLFSSSDALLAGTQLTITGPIAGNGGTVLLGSKLGVDSSATDALVLSGTAAIAQGMTNLLVVNRGGLGALTTGSGIPVVLVQNGATADVGTFVLANAGGHIDAGAYQYHLTDAAGTRYLTTFAAVPDIKVTTNRAYRNEVALYNALPNILRQGDLAMLSTLHRRVGDENRQIVVDDGSDEGWVNANRRGCGRAIGGNINMAQAGDASLSSHANMGGFQSGVDIYVGHNWGVGVYVGALETNSSVNGNVGGIFGSAGTMRSDSKFIGGYGTYLDNGFYTDLVFQYGMHRLSVTAPNTQSNSNAFSTMASIEVGKRFSLGHGWALEPQAQLIYGRSKLDTVDIAGATVQQDANGKVFGRLGARITTDMATSLGHLQPYARLNLWHGFSGKDTTTFVNPAATTPISTSVGYTSTETALGLTLQLAPMTSLYGEVGKLFRVGNSDDAQVRSSVEGSIGLKIGF